MNKRVKCRFCKHRWQPRAEKPLACPKCKRYDWEKAPTKESIDAPVAATGLEAAAKSVETK